MKDAFSTYNTAKKIKVLNDCRRVNKPINLKKLPTKGAKRGGNKDCNFIKIGGIRLF